VKILHHISHLACDESSSQDFVIAPEGEQMVDLDSEMGLGTSPDEEQQMVRREPKSRGSTLAAVDSMFF
jgi:hypothetical protein